MSKLTFEVTDANFQESVLQSETPVLIDFWAEWCNPCKMIAPVVDEIAQKYEGKLKVGKLDVDHNQQVPSLFDVSGIPALILFKGGQPVQFLVGYKTKAQLENALAPHLV